LPAAQEYCSDDEEPLEPFDGGNNAAFEEF
jgi:hypothetical protein